MAALEDEDAQINGFCNIKYDYGKSSPPPASQHTTTMIDVVARDPLDLGLSQDESLVTYNHSKLFRRLENAMPFRINVLHICYINPRLTDLFNIAVMNASKHQRARLRFHYGPHMECQYELMTFGIRPDSLPVNRDGEESLTNHYNWIQRRRAKEAIDLLESNDGHHHHHLQQPQQQQHISLNNGHNPAPASPILSGEVDTNSIMPIQWPGLEYDSSSSNNAQSHSTAYPSSSSDDDSCTNIRMGNDDGYIHPEKLSVIDEDREQQQHQTQSKPHQKEGKKAKNQKRQQGQGKPKKFIAVPKHEDVILGRGNKNHYGNMRFRQIIDSHRQEYEASDKAGKTSIAEVIVREVKERGGRFLKNDVGGWVELDDSSARYKVSHRFRNMRILDSSVGVGGSNHNNDNSSNNNKNNKKKSNKPKRPNPCNQDVVTPIATNSNASILSVPLSNKRGRTSDDEQGCFCQPK